MKNTDSFSTDSISKKSSIYFPICYLTAHPTLLQAHEYKTSREKNHINVLKSVLSSYYLPVTEIIITTRRKKSEHINAGQPFTAL